MLQALPWLRGSSLFDAFLDEPGIILPQLLQAGNAERNLVDGGVDRLLGTARGNGDLMMLDRIAAEERDVEAAPGMTAVGHHQPEDARVEIDHLFEVEGIKANVAELGIGHRSWISGSADLALHRPARNAGMRIRVSAPDFGLDFLLLYDIAVRWRTLLPFSRGFAAARTIEIDASATSQGAALGYGRAVRPRWPLPYAGGDLAGCGVDQSEQTAAAAFTSPGKYNVYTCQDIDSAIDGCRACGRWSWSS